MSYQLRVSFSAIGHSYSVFIAEHRWQLVARAHRLLRHLLRVHNDATYFVEPAADRAGRAGKG